MEENSIKINILYIFLVIFIVIFTYKIYKYIHKDDIPIALLENNEFIYKNKLVTFNSNSKNVALMVESRIFPNTEFIIRQFSRYLPNDFAMCIYATDDVYDKYVDLAHRLNNNINVLKLPYQLKSLKDYNDIMLNKLFWKLLDKYERVLIFQNDTMIYNYNVGDFYKYDYIGAPWPNYRNIAKNVGNGGLSMRNIDAMIYCIENEESVNIPFNIVYSYENKFIFNGKYPEDVFFSYAMLQFGYNVADDKTASLFSIESCMYNNDTFGSHKLSVYNQKLYERLLLKSIFTPKFNYIIPLNIFQTWHSKKLPSMMKEYTKLIQYNNPEFKYYLFDDNDCIEFIKNNFEPDVLEAFNKLVPGAYKADLWRYCILYIKGGIYLDIKYKPVKDFKFINLVEKEHWVLDADKKGIYNGLMICKAGNPILYSAIKQIVENVSNNFYGEKSLEPTGPLLLEKYFNEEEKNNFDMKHTFYINYKKYICFSPSKNHNKSEDYIIFESYNNYNIELKDNANVPHYSILWEQKNIYK
jgi:mannosyltransferase OCH1-like enzyme